jgi:hypothetical protein
MKWRAFGRMPQWVRLSVLVQQPVQIVARFAITI